jgi:hypothetical protein
MSAGWARAAMLVSSKAKTTANGFIDPPEHRNCEPRTLNPEVGRPKRRPPHVNLEHEPGTENLDA